MSIWLLTSVSKQGKKYRKAFRSSLDAMLEVSKFRDINANEIVDERHLTGTGFYHGVAYRWCIDQVAAA
jgi:hypothetical protein